MEHFQIGARILVSQLKIYFDILPDHPDKNLRKMGFFGRSTAGDIPGRPRDPSCSRADVRLQLLVFSGAVSFVTLGFVADS
jgi:hypothetical protein